MPTVFRLEAFRVVVFPNDHDPPHVHVVGPDGRAKFALGSVADDVALIEADGIPRAALRRIASEIIDRHGECRESWRQCHGNQNAGPKGR